MSEEISGPGKGKRPVEILDVEDEEQRQERMHEILRNLDAPSATKTTPNGKIGLLKLNDGKMFATEPPSELLSRVQAFLPQLAASNAELLRQAQDDPSSIDIENTANDERYIEMNLGLGVFEQRGGAAVQKFDADLQDDPSSESSSSHSSDAESSSDADSDSDSDVDVKADDDAASDVKMEVDSLTPVYLSKSARPIKPFPKRKPSKPGIVVLGEGGASDTGNAVS